ncbi:hypothetical protein [Pseudomonas atacamensis]|uniref:hypothetical protein n=1 Tax=Pseudomonas atacamensis TaxID=2565368 RepID=UPI001FAD395B|nr:hypothetical protein [Pseudomonas atacamensis]MCI9876952.1 hypothetical protein [Pseudomonas atacamensis]
MGATGSISGNQYSETDILTERYLRMREEPLFSANDELVVPVRNINRPHFRRVGRASFGARVGRSENNPTHNECVDLIFERLSSNDRANRLITYVFAPNTPRSEQVFFAPGVTSDYRWYKESDARIAFDDGTYIQPDLAGRDANRFFPRANCPSIIIEVVRTHAPEVETFRRLYEVSLANTIVVFYFVAQDKVSGILNHMTVTEALFTLRVSHYMMGGQLYNNGEPACARREDEELGHWFRYLQGAYFEPAMRKA